MRLKKGQKEAVLKWIVTGLQSDEINERGADHAPAFAVSRQQVDYYRKTRAADIKALVMVGEQEALAEGLAVTGQRVIALKKLAALMERDLFGGFLWLDQVKSIGAGDCAEVVDYEIFNKAEVDAYRGVLDDIAKETGGRVTKQEITGKDGGPMAFDAGAWREKREQRLAEVAATIAVVPDDGSDAVEEAVEVAEVAAANRRLAEIERQLSEMAGDNG